LQTKPTTRKNKLTQVLAMLHQDIFTTKNNFEAPKKRGKKNPSSSLGPKLDLNLNLGLPCDVELLVVSRVVQKHLQKKNQNK